MAAGKKKTKKPAANPARGFATTSIQSKTKVEPLEDGQADETPLKKKVEDSALPPSQAISTEQSDAQALRELHELTPEELEAQLETSDLQSFVEQFGPKVRKESSRHASRQQTEKRLLRGQAEFLSVRQWLPNDIAKQVTELVSASHIEDVVTTSKQSFPSGDDLVSKVWQLQACLLELGFSLTRVQGLLQVLVSRSRIEDSTSPLWGLNDALQWLSIHCDADELRDYDDTISHAALTAVNDYEEDTELLNDSNAESRINQSSAPNGTGHTDEPVSDVGSDLDPNEMLEAYLRTKARLFKINPDSDLPRAGGRAVKKQAGSVDGRTESPLERKLNHKLRKLRSDLLFDQQDAELKWAVKKTELQREQAELKKLRLDEGSYQPATQSASSEQHSSSVMEEADRLAKLTLAEAEDGSDSELLGGMFDALPGVRDNTPDAASLSQDEPITIRNFGKITGLNPRRILEEAVKARDSGARVTIRMISPTTYSCRHSATIKWSKPRNLVPPLELTGLSVSEKRSISSVSMSSIAAPDITQSEAYIATAALFVIFSDSPKEAKSSLRLPPAYRDVWDELLKDKSERSDSTDRDTVKHLRALIEENPPIEDSEDKIIYDPAHRRMNGSSGTSTPVSTPAMASSVGSSSMLSDLWQRKSSSPAYQAMLEVRSRLPMFGFREKALNIISQHQVTILCGETGCGKSTQLPAFILEHELSQGRDCKIYCTEPRRISAISLAQRVSEEMGDKKGDVGTNRSLVGYAIRLESHTASSTKLIYATVGIVLRMLEGQDGLRDITHLVIDEVHERSIDTDFLLVILRTLMLKRPDLKVILMSATVDAQRFSAYFDGAPIITVPGRTFPVRALFLEDAIELTGHSVDAVGQREQDDELEGIEEPQGSVGDLSGYSKKTRSTLAEYDEYRIDYELILRLLEKLATSADYADFSKAVLVFLPGIAEIRQLNDMLGGHPIFSRKWRVIPLHSTFSSEDQQAAFDIPPDGIKKIVIATNIAETGITIPDVTCVIDTGKHKEMRFDERRQMSRLIQSFIARANAKQRRGRAGRVQEGICFHLFTKYRHDSLMVDQQTPEMLRLSLQDLVMRVKICRLGDIETALSQALDPPASKNIRRAIDALIEVNALTPAEELTPLGQQLAKLPVDAQLGKLLLLGALYNCLDTALTIAATLSSKSPFLTPMHAKNQADTIRLGFKRGDSDLLTTYNAYSTWRKLCTTAGMSEYQFCNKNFLSSANLANIEDLKAQLLHSMVDAGFVHLGPEELHALSRMRHNPRHRNFVALPPSACRFDDNDYMANSVIAWSFYPKILRRDGKGWRNVANNQSLALHQTSVNKKQLSPDIRSLSFYSIMQTSRFTNAQETSAVADFALVLLAGDAVFNLFAGVITIDGNRLRFKVNDWKTMIMLKTMRIKLRECQAKLLRHPGKPLGARLQRWMDVFAAIFERRQAAIANIKT